MRDSMLGAADREKSADTSMATAPKTVMAIRTISIRTLLYLDRHDLLDREEAQKLEAHGGGKHDLPAEFGEKQAHVGRVHHHEHREHQYGQRTDDDAGHALLRSERGNFATNALPLAHGERYLVQ